MDNEPLDGQDDEFSDLWAVPLHEPAPPVAPVSEPPISDGTPTITLFESDDLSSDVGFHPRLRRFDEAA
jgi:hypothetical protein